MKPQEKLGNGNVVNGGDVTRSMASGAASSASPLLSCPIASRISFLLGWLFAIVVVFSCEDYTVYLAKLHKVPLGQELEAETGDMSTSSCEGGLVYVYRIAEVYNREFVRDCAGFKKGRDLCMYMEESGMGRGFEFGPEQGGPAPAPGRGPWHNTWQFALELYFHERLLRHPCVTDRAELASAFFVPYYAGMDLSRRFTHRLAKGDLYSALAAWLRGQETWKRRRGRNHFIMLGRIASDFHRPGGDRAWGNAVRVSHDFGNILAAENAPQNYGRPSVHPPSSSDSSNNRSHQQSTPTSSIPPIKGLLRWVDLTSMMAETRRPGLLGAKWGRLPELSEEMLRHDVFKEMVMLSIERTTSGPFRKSAAIDKEIAIPYPTYFHDSSNAQLRALVDWSGQASQRISLVTMAAGQRQASTNRMRHRLMTQCGGDPRCTLLLCVGNEAFPVASPSDETRNISLPVKMEGKTLNVACNNPPVLLSAMHQSEFCLQPPGDSPTRRSFFDAMLVGCIPVIFQKEAAWSQYIHHLPKDGASYSVFIPMTLAYKSNVIDILSQVSQSRIREMRANIAKLIPRILYASINEMRPETSNYAGPSADTPDAFDIALDAVLERIKSISKNPNSS